MSPKVYPVPKTGFFSCQKSLFGKFEVHRQILTFCLNPYKL